MMSSDQICVSRTILDEIYNSRELDYHIQLGCVRLHYATITIFAFRRVRSNHELSKDLRFIYKRTDTHTHSTRYDYSFIAHLVISGSDPRKMKYTLSGTECDQRTEQILFVLNPFNFEKRIDALSFAFTAERLNYHQQVEPFNHQLGVVSNSPYRTWKNKPITIPDAAMSTYPDRVTKCSICQDRKADILIFNCRHVCICASCATCGSRTYKCPICREPIVKVTQIYFS